MTSLTTALDNELKTFAPTIFGAVEILLPGYTLRLLDGAGAVTFDGRTFVGRDATFGVLAAASTLSDGSGDEECAIASARGSCEF